MKDMFRCKRSNLPSNSDDVFRLMLTESRLYVPLMMSHVARCEHLLLFRYEIPLLFSLFPFTVVQSVSLLLLITSARADR